jgi:hypothetical protein
MAFSVLESFTARPTGTLRTIAQISALRRLRTGRTQLFHRQFAVTIPVEFFERLRGAGNFLFVNLAVVIGIKRADKRRDGRSWSVRTLSIRSRAAQAFTVFAWAALTRSAVARTIEVATLAFLKTLRSRGSGFIIVLGEEICGRRSQCQRHQEGCGMYFHIVHFRLTPAHHALASRVIDLDYVKPVCGCEGIFVKGL